MASLPGWGSQTFNNVTKLLGKSKTWNDLVGSAAKAVPNWSGAFSAAPSIDPTLAYTWAKSGGTLPTDLTAISNQGFTNFDPQTAAVPADFWSSISQYQAQNAALADASALKNYGLSQAYMNQLNSASEAAKNADFQRNMNAFMAQQNSPQMTALIGASKQQQMATAQSAADAALTAMSNAALNAGTVSAMGYRLGMRA